MMKSSPYVGAVFAILSLMFISSHADESAVRISAQAKENEIIKPFRRRRSLEHSGSSDNVKGWPDDECCDEDAPSPMPTFCECLNDNDYCEGKKGSGKKGSGKKGSGKKDSGKKGSGKKSSKGKKDSSSGKKSSKGSKGKKDSSSGKKSSKGKKFDEWEYASKKGKKGSEKEDIIDECTVPTQAPVPDQRTGTPSPFIFPTVLPATDNPTPRPITRDDHPIIISPNMIPALTPVYAPHYKPSLQANAIYVFEEAETETE